MRRSAQHRRTSAATAGQPRSAATTERCGRRASTSPEAAHRVPAGGVNEEWRDRRVRHQQLDLYPKEKKHDGVFGIWYGRGRAWTATGLGQARQHGRRTSKHGGVIAIAGDDHGSKSSTAAHQSDHIFKACGLPVFFPSNVQDILDMGAARVRDEPEPGLWAA